MKDNDKINPEELVKMIQSNKDSDTQDAGLGFSIKIGHSLIRGDLYQKQILPKQYKSILNAKNIDCVETLYSFTETSPPEISETSSPETFQIYVATGIFLCAIIGSLIILSNAEQYYGDE